jgi:hypothetical protein
MTDEEIELLGEPKMSMAEFQRDEEAQFKECELCGTRVHIDLEYLEEKGCIYCQEETPEVGEAEQERVTMSEQKLSERLQDIINRIHKRRWGPYIEPEEAREIDAQEERDLFQIRLAFEEFEARLSKMEKALDIERLATIEHTQWMAWARTLMDEEPGLSASRRDRWQAMMVDYSELPEETKEYDREWARIVIGEALAGESR